MGFKLRGLGSPKFSAPRSSKNCMSEPRLFLEVQERARGPLSPRQIWRAWISSTAGWPKALSFFCLSVFVCLSVSLFVHHGFESQSLCALFRIEGVGVGNDFWVTVCKTVRPLLSDCCLSVCLCPVCPVLSVLSVIFRSSPTDDLVDWNSGVSVRPYVRMSVHPLVCSKEL